MSSRWGENFRCSIFGESHGPSIGVVIDGLPPGILLDEKDIAAFMKRRAPGRAKHSTPRQEADKVAILSGVYKNVTTGTPLCGVMQNTNIRSQDYEEMPLRPSHGDYTGHIRYQGYNDPRGGGHFSGRLTAPLVFAGGVAKAFLEKYGIYVGAHISSIGNVDDDDLEDQQKNKLFLEEISFKDFPVINSSKGSQMQDLIEDLRQLGDSIGGVIKCYAIGVPAGLGSPMFQGLENKISSIIFGIPAVRGIEFGTGFSAASLRGSEHNDDFILSDGCIQTKTNHHGGILGGIASGMPIELSVAIKPTPSIRIEQSTVDIDTKKETQLRIKGRHDPCIVPRAVPVVEAAVAIALADALLEGGNPIASRFISSRD